jgi:hypothetical protein
MWWGGGEKDKMTTCAYIILEHDLQSEIKKERNLVLDEVLAICKNSKNTIEHRHDATYHADARMDEVTDIIIKVSSLRNGMIK